MLGLSVIIAQTTILRRPSFDGVFYDLLIPIVVFLSLYFPKRKGVALVVALGLLMDLLSGGIFGLYLSIYFWIFLLVKGLSKYFDVHDTTFRMVLIGVCVLGQHLVFCISVAPPWKGTQLLTAQIGTVLWQTVFAALTGPGILVFLRRLQVRFAPPSLSVKKETGDLATK